MDDGTPYCLRPKHLPQLVPKIDESNCPTATEIARIECVKPRDAEGILLRRKWKKKVMAAQKENYEGKYESLATRLCRSKRARSANSEGQKMVSFRPMETIEEGESVRTKQTTPTPYLHQTRTVKSSAKCRSPLARTRCSKRKLENLFDQWIPSGRTM